MIIPADGVQNHHIHASCVAKKVGVSLAVMTAAGALVALGTLFFFSRKLEATRLAPLGRYMSQHPLAFRISGAMSIALAIIPLSSLPLYLATSCKRREVSVSNPSTTSDEVILKLDQSTLVGKQDYPETLTLLPPILISFNGQLRLTPIYRGTNNDLYYFYADPLPEGRRMSSHCNTETISPATIDKPLYSMPKK